MAAKTDILDLSVLPAADRRELRDFYQFLLLRSAAGRRKATAKAGRSFSDLCGTLSWEGDAIASQRKLRDEW